jgi:hypothetical protein
MRCPCHVFPTIVTCYVWFYAHQCVPLVLHHHCLLHVVVVWIVNVLVFKLNKLTPSPNTFFATMCDFCFQPSFLLHCRDCNFHYCHCLLHCYTRKKRRIQCTSSSFSSIFSLIFKWTSSTKPHPLMCFFWAMWFSIPSHVISLVVIIVMFCVFFIIVYYTWSYANC